MSTLIEGTVAVGLSGAAGAVGIATTRAHALADPRADRLARIARFSRGTVISAVAVLSVLVVSGPFFAAAIVCVSAGIRWIQSIRRRGQARRAIGEQLIDAVTSLGAGLRAGLSLERALRFTAEEAEEPLGLSLRQLIGDIDVGVPMDAALEGWALDGGDPDVRLIAGVLRLDRRSGGDLPRILDQVASTLRERREAQGEVRALTAQARLSGLILGLLPIGFFLFLVVTSSKDVSAALHTPVGVGAVGLGSVLEVAAFLWIRHLLEVR